MEAGTPSNGRATGVFAPVEACHHLDQADRIDVPNARGVGIVAGAHGVAVQGQDITHVVGVRADEVAL